MNRTRGFFVTGTDTGVGKTLVSCALLHAFAAEGLRTIGMKPVAAGAQSNGTELVNEDVTALRAASSVAAPEDLVNPYCFAPPIAPHIAAAQAGVTIDIGHVKRASLALREFADCIVVEGAGGFYVPLAPGLGMADLAAALGLPVVLVVGMRLGCLSHALLTAEAIRAKGLQLAGWVANEIVSDMPEASANVAALEERLDAPLVARISYGEHVDAKRVARRLRIDRLQESGALSG